MQLADNQRVFAPKTLTDCLNIYRRRPEARISAGGTYLSLLDNPEIRGQDVLSLHYIEELRRVFRSDRTVDIGSMVSLERLIDLEPGVIPPGLREGAAQIASPQVRSLATIGGNIFVGNKYLGLLSWLVLNDARFELRRSAGFRWISAARFWQDGAVPSLEPGEILTRIRLPYGRWNVQQIERFEIGGDLPGQDFLFCGLAAVNGGSIEDLRIAYCTAPNLIFQNRVTDAEMVGRKTPLGTKDIHAYEALLLENLPLPDVLDFPFMRDRVRNLALSFLYSIGRSRDVSQRRRQI